MKNLLLVFVFVLSATLSNAQHSDYELTVTADITCFLKIDGKQFKVEKQQAQTFPISRGVHMIVATTLDGYYKIHNEFFVNKNKEFLEINLTAKIAETIENDKLLKRHNLTYVQGGTFKMGDRIGNGDRDEHLHQVQVNSFYIGKFEITKEQFRQFVDATGYETRAEKDGWAYTWNGQRIIKEYGANWNNVTSDPRSAVTCIAWLDAVKYCNWLSKKEGFELCYGIIDTVVSFHSEANGYRLPTEAEWEFAARGGRKSKGYEYSGGNDPAELGWTKANANYQIHRVGLKKSNELGIHDMVGNVSEWCWDKSYKDYYLTDGGIHKNPLGPEKGKGRVQRSGGALFPARYARVANRGMASEDEKGIMEGFRIVRNAS